MTKCEAEDSVCHGARGWWSESAKEMYRAEDDVKHVVELSNVRSAR